MQGPCRISRPPIPTQPDHAHQDAARAKGFSRICGVDEAGRGPLAGPVVCAAVILDAASVPEGLNDSKALSPTRRERLLNALESRAEIAIAVIEPVEIDAMNILWASLAGMRRAVGALQADYALIDGNRLPPGLTCPGEAVVKGDARSLAIAAASIAAKVARDRLMVEADRRWPGYGFARHKGYPTQAHREALIRLGPCAVHRRSFGPVRGAWQPV
ncbi:ribonuclease HII [uncultured Algimonas sp.]|uniref:ribonuclease HII n=1 Tax=uncultured Algimonas sp. TaxID=1547920 RepID=UPI00262BBB7F|nr:ribonuclease HII [uncultured Algimonas sp.]